MKRVACLAALLLLCSVVSASADPAILRGIDTFTTTTDGSTHYSFATNPIPAGFFCKGSAPFAGDVPLKGLPLVTAEKDQLHGADTIVERLDEAAFDRNGVAVTRIKMAALSLVSIEPIQTSCGPFHVYVSLAREQRTTTMHIYKEHEHGGTFVAPLAVDARMRFVPVNGSAERPLELTGSFNLGAPSQPWALPSGKWLGELGTTAVDTDGDGIPDRRFAGTGNFAAGFHSAWAPEEAVRACTRTICHDQGTDEAHCITLCCTCQIP